MIQHLKPYPAYKDSGVPWLGQVPEHWEARRLKRIARLNPSKSEVPLAMRNDPAVFLPMERVGSDGRFDASEVQPISALWNGFTYFRRGDVIVAKITPCFENGKGACLQNLPTSVGFGSTEFHVIRPSAAVTAPYLYRVTTLSEFRRLGADEMTGAAGQQRVPVEFIANFLIPLPPLAEQTAIVRFLDYMDRRIRRYIRAKQKLVKLLEEYKQTLIHQAVTGQIDVRTGKPYPAYKDSGVPWLGQVPEHWDVRRIKTIARIRYGLGQPPKEMDGGIPMLRATNINRGTICEKDLLHVDPSDVPSNRGAFLHAGEIIVVRSGAFTADSAIVPEAYDGAVAGYDMVVTALKVSPRFLAAVLLTPYVRDDQLTVASMRSAQPHLNAEELGAALVALPPLPEQSAIVEYLDAQTAKIDAAIAASRREIELLRECRTRLIADVVTGKVDVREVAARLPEEPAEEEDELEDTEETAEGEAADNEAAAETFSEEEVEP